MLVKLETEHGPVVVNSEHVTMVEPLGEGQTRLYLVTSFSRLHVVNEDWQVVAAKLGYTGPTS